MTSLFKQFKTDSKIEREGVWLEYGETDEGKPIRFRIARAGGSNTKYTKISEQITRPYRRQIQAGTLDKATSERLAREIYANAVVITWENVNDEDGNPIAFSVPAAIELFTKLPDLFDDIVSQSSSLALYRLDVRENDAKN